MTGERTARYERLMVVLSVHLCSSRTVRGVADKDDIQDAITRVQAALGVRVMPPGAVWLHLAEVLHEGIISRHLLYGVSMYEVTDKGLTWILEAVAGLGADDAQFREALTRGGLNPDDALRRIFAVRQARRTAEALSTGDRDAIVEALSQRVGAVVVLMLSDIGRVWTVFDLCAATGTSEDSVRREIDTALRRDWLTITDTPQGRAYGLTTLGRTESALMIADMQRRSGVFESLATAAQDLDRLAEETSRARPDVAADKGDDQT